MSPKDDITKHIKEAPPIIESVLKSFKVTTTFVAGIANYNQEVRRPFTKDDWVAFLDRYAIMMWNSRDICRNANEHIPKLKDVLKLATRPDPNLPEIKVAVQDYLNFKDTTAEKSKALVDNLQTLDYNILTWKGTVFEWIDKNIPKTTPSNPHLAEAYRLVMQALNDLKHHLPPEDRTDMKTAWFSDIEKPVTVSTIAIQKTWIEVWYEARSIVLKVGNAEDAATIRGMKGILEQALSAYEILGKALGEYLLKLQEGDLYWAYENAIRRHPPAGRLD